MTAATSKQLDTWQQALDILENSMTKATFNTWLRGTQLNAVEDQIWTIEANSEAAVDWLSNRLNGQIENALANVVGSPVEVRYIIQETPAYIVILNALYRYIWILDTNSLATSQKKRPGQKASPVWRSSRKPGARSINSMIQSSRSGLWSLDW